LALPQKMNLHSHMFRKALYSTSVKGPSHICFLIYLLYPTLFYSFFAGGAFVFVRVHGSCDIKAGYHICIGPSGRHWCMTKKKSIDTIRPKNDRPQSEDPRFWVFGQR
jgi:hypothetical protein